MGRTMSARLLSGAALSSAILGGGLLAATPGLAQGTDPAVVEAARAHVASVGTPPSEWPGPQTSPAAAEGKRVAIISCSQASNCSVDATAAQDAAEQIGWEATIIDGKGDPALYNASLRSAVNSGYDGIINISLPPALVQDGLRYAAEHDVPVINAADVVSDDPLVFANVEHQWKDQGIMLGQWLIADSDGTAGVVVLRDDEFPGVKERQDNVVAVLETCAGCTVLDEIGLTISQATSPPVVAQQVQSLIARFGDDLEYIVAPFGTVDGLVIPALRAADRTDIKVVGYDGNTQQVQLCHAGSIGAVAVTMLAWTGWGAVDQLNRAFQGEPKAEQKVPAFLATSETCAEEGLAEDVSTFDFKGEYLRLWGKSAG